MASLVRRNKSYRLTFCFHGKRHTFTIGEESQDVAEAKCTEVEETLRLMKRRRLQLPDGVNLVQFVKAGGKVEEIKPSAGGHDVGGAGMTLGALKHKYLEEHIGAMEDNSLATVRMHLGHFEKTLNTGFVMGELTTAHLQRHVNRRKDGRRGGRKISPVTLRKEMATLRAVWNWATHLGHLGSVKMPFPGRGIVYPKGKEKSPFMTLGEIEARLAADDGRDGEASLWESLYLTVDETKELLDFIKVNAGQPWVYPLVATAAYTGARRSELLRIGLVDVDWRNESVLITEKKTKYGKGNHKTRSIAHAACEYPEGVVDDTSRRTVFVRSKQRSFSKQEAKQK